MKVGDTVRAIGLTLEMRVTATGVGFEQTEPEPSKSPSEEPSKSGGGGSAKYYEDGVTCKWHELREGKVTSASKTYRPVDLQIVHRAGWPSWTTIRRTMGVLVFCGVGVVGGEMIEIGKELVKHTDPQAQEERKPPKDSPESDHRPCPAHCYDPSGAVMDAGPRVK
jgi:hypothetical protein